MAKAAPTTLSRCWRKSPRTWKRGARSGPASRCWRSSTTTASAKPEDLHAYGLRAAAAGQFQPGLDALLRLLRDHHDYQDGVARSALLEVFECLPKGDPLASEYRRKMFTYLY